MEPTTEEYVARMVEVFREVRRVLRDDGTCWVNLGDAYGTSMFSHNHARNVTQPQNNWSGTKLESRKSRIGNTVVPRNPIGLKPKDLIGIPWLVAFALRDDDWYLRSDIVWAKPNPMPESVTDRPTRSHEYIFLLTKQPRYYYDADAIREAQTSNNTHFRSGTYTNGNTDNSNGKPGAYWGERPNPLGRNKRSVWTVATQPFPRSHFAVFPEKLIEPCILAGTSPKTCPHCGAPWERVVDRPFKGDNMGKRSDNPHANGHLARPPQGARYDGRTTGFRPTCACPDNDGSGRSVVLDPFVGSGTTLVVAERLDRNAIGIELSPEYAEMARQRVRRAQGGGQMKLRVDLGEIS